MCNDCWKHFKGWCKSFTKTEILLSVLEALLLIVFFAFLIFLILHLVVCLKNKQKHETPAVMPTESNAKGTESISDVTGQYEIITKSNTVTQETKSAEVHTQTVPTLNQNLTCTWRPSEKTKALTHYYENITKVADIVTKKLLLEKHKTQVNQHSSQEQVQIEEYKLSDSSDHPDGEDTDDTYNHFLLALVKIKPLQDLTFGCTLTVVSRHWTLTAASCLQAIEEVDSLDSFVMMQGFKDNSQSHIHSVADVMIHPQFQGINATYDLAALKSEDNLVERGKFTLTLPSMMDYFLLTIGERFTILGYGKFRSLDKDVFSRTIRKVSVHSVPLSQCSAGSGKWSPRHLIGGTAVEHPACGTAGLCAGVLRGRTAPCNYCAGTPLLSRQLLLGVMSDYQLCGLACEPALFVNLALVSDWINSVLYSN